MLKYLIIKAEEESLRQNYNFLFLNYSSLTSVMCGTAEIRITRLRFPQVHKYKSQQFVLTLKQKEQQRRVTEVNMV